MLPSARSSSRSASNRLNLRLLDPELQTPIFIDHYQEAPSLGSRDASFEGCEPLERKEPRTLALVGFRGSAFRKVHPADVVDDEDAALINNTGKAYQILCFAPRNFHAEY